MVKTVAMTRWLIDRGGHFFKNQGHLMEDQLDFSCLILQKRLESHHIISFKASCFFHC